MLLYEILAYTATGLEPTTTQFINEQASLAKWLSVRL